MLQANKDGVLLQLLQAEDLQVFAIRFVRVPAGLSVEVDRVEYRTPIRTERVKVRGQRLKVKIWQGSWQRKRAAIKTFPIVGKLYM